MKNPLNKRILRELRKEWKKYLILFAMLALTIAMVSGVYVANDSMLTAADEAYEKYNIEDGHFTLKNEASDELIKAFENEDIKIYRQFYVETNEDADLDGEKDAKIRVFTMREDINRACLIKGEFPENENEIVIDRMHADNNKIKVGSKIKLGDEEFTVSGLVSFSDYSCLYEKSTDMIFDAITFNVGAVTKEGFEKLGGNVKYQYAFNFTERPKDDEKSKKSEEIIKKIAVLSLTGGLTDDRDEAEKIKDDPELVKAYIENIGNVNEVLEFVPEYVNQAIHFAPDDMGSDKVLCEVLLVVLVIVLAFISG
ncbi:MAG: permease, partial [Lachnospiraceae bacterium]|nr:permease [Lachnospiraceae bacterium]